MSLPIPAGTYGIDPMHTHLGFQVTHLGISLVRGAFTSFTGSLSVGETLADTSVSLEAEMASVSSGVPYHDQHLAGAEFFDAENHPKLTFEATSIAEAGSGYALTGNLTIKGVTQPVTLQASYNGAGVYPMDQSTRYGFSATGTISRSAFGISYGVPMVSDDVKLSLDAQFVSPAAG